MLIVHDTQVFEILLERDFFYQVRRPFDTSAKPIWVEKENCKPYPRTNEQILNRWIPNYDHVQIWEVERYLLEVLSALLTPKFFLAPKENGYYTAIWLDEDNSVQITMVLYHNEHPRLSESEHLEGYNLYLFEKMAWTQLIHFVANENFRYLRFIPTQVGWSYVYLLNLIESGLFTPEEVNRIWGK